VQCPSTSGSRTEAWTARAGAVPQEVMTAHELRATTSLMTLMVLAGIAGFVTLLVLKNMLKARRRARGGRPEHCKLMHLNYCNCHMHGWALQACEQEYCKRLLGS